MAIKRPGKDIPSFDQIRRSPKAAFIGREQAEAPALADASQTKELLPTKVSASKEPTVEIPDPSPVPDPAPVSDAPARPLKTKVREMEAKPAPEPKARPELTPPPSESVEAALLKARIQLPMAGHNAEFDKVASAYGDKKALQLVLTTALAEYEAAIIGGEIKEALTEYPKGQGGVKVSRMFGIKAFERARGILDPLGMLPEGTFAAALCKNALSLHFSRSSE